MPRRLQLVLLAVGALFGSVVGSATAVAQITVSPEAVEVAVPAGQATEVALTVTNGSAEPQPLALSLAPAEGPGDGTEPGDTLFTSAPGVVYSGADLAMTPEGRLFVSVGTGHGRETVELTAELEFVRKFEHPTTAFLSSTVGLAHSPDTGGGNGGGSLWWMDVQNDGGDPTQALLLEGALDGNATGRTLTVPYGEDGGCGFLNSGRPAGLAYDRDASGEGRFYYLDIREESVWAIDTLGAVADGYPVPMSGYVTEEEPCSIGVGLDAHTLPPADPDVPAEPLFEVLHAYPGEHPSNRVTRAVVLDREGHNRGAETPLFDLPTPDGFGNVRRILGVVRSRLDPSVLYLTVATGFAGDVRYWVYAVRAAPLPPVWLRAEEILFEVGEESEREVVLTLDASGLEPGVYEGVVSVRAGDGIGPVVAEVPVALTVTPATDAEGDAEPTEAFRLLPPFPNPSSGAVTVPVALDERAEVRVAVYDVLGREVAVLHEGPLAAGEHRLTLEGERLPAGVYVVRVTSGAYAAKHRFTLVR